MGNSNPPRQGREKTRAKLVISLSPCNQINVSPDIDVLRSIEDAGWLWLYGNGAKDVLIDCLSSLLVNTHNSEKPFNEYGFSGGALDGRGFSRYDYGNALYFYDSLLGEKMPPTNGATVKATANLLYRYREQLRKRGYDYPNCLFVGRVSQ